MPLLIGRRVEHQGQTLMVGYQGRLYAPHTCIDAWGRTRHTQKLTKFRMVACPCGSAFIAHNGRMKTCAACREQVQPARYTRQVVEAPPPATIACAQCDQRVIVQRRTRRYCSRACQQKAYQERRPASQVSQRPASS
ncbi:MAG TPA: hypothetical protein PK820_15825 [Candidatus Competibacteraceae bacterium]|nr:hypothetical protein [Candidatus Competibacteraceae bacterium]